MRGNTYVFVTGEEGAERVHLWAEGGKDGMEESGWMARGATNPAVHGNKAGVAIPLATFDELVVMRFAELRRDGLVRKARTRAIAKHAGNGGCLELEYQMGQRSRED